MRVAYRRIIWFIVGVCGLLLFWLAFPRHTPPGALYAGKDALYWSQSLAGTLQERTNGLVALRSMGPAAAHDLAAILPVRITWRNRTLGAIAKILPGRLAWTLLRPTGYFNRPPEQAAAASGLEALGADARSVIPEMEAAILLGGPDVYGPLVNALVQINPEGILALGRVLHMGEISRASYVANRLRLSGTNAFLVLPDLLAVATNQQPGGEFAALAIGAIGEKALPAIRALLGDKDKKIVAIGINSLGAMGPFGEPCLAELNALAEKGNLELRAKAIMAIGRVNPNRPKSLALLKESARAPESAIRMAAVSAFQNTPFHLWSDRSLFNDLLNDPDPEVRKQTRALLGEKNPLDGR